jgi:hypothetical protein
MKAAQEGQALNLCDRPCIQTTRTELVTPLASHSQVLRETLLLHTTNCVVSLTAVCYRVG